MLTGTKDILAIIMAWAITFTAICTLIICLGFGPVGIGAGMWSSLLQGYLGIAVYSQLTDVATGAAILVWVLGIGRS